MWQDDRQIALGDIVVASREFADHCRDSAAQIDHPDLAALFNQLAAVHSGVGDELEQHLRATGALPRDPDPEAEEVQRLARHFKARFAVDAPRTILEERIAAEREIEDLVAAARQCDLSTETATCLARVAGAVADARVQLEETAAQL